MQTRLRGREVLIASATSVATATSITASPAIAAAGIDRIAGTIERGTVAAEPTGDVPAIAGTIITAVRSGAVAGRCTLCAAALQSRHQEVADQRCRADRNPEDAYRAGHCFRSRSTEGRMGLCTAKAAALPTFVAKCGNPVH